MRLQWQALRWPEALPELRRPPLFLIKSLRCKVCFPNCAALR